MKGEQAVAKTAKDLLGASARVRGGLGSEEAARRLKIYGPNRLVRTVIFQIPASGP